MHLTSSSLLGYFESSFLCFSESNRRLDSSFGRGKRLTLLINRGGKLVSLTPMSFAEQFKNLHNEIARVCMSGYSYVRLLRQPAALLAPCVEAICQQSKDPVLLLTLLLQPLHICVALLQLVLHQDRQVQVAYERNRRQEKGYVRIQARIDYIDFVLLNAAITTTE